jgi:6-pyruvoyl-tetrahydropterin synthase related domain
VSIEWQGARRPRVYWRAWPGEKREILLVAAALLFTATALTLPAALGPVRLNDSFWIDCVWLEQFARALGNGTLYPRWLPLSHGGLGSPVFYYYPPLAFYAGSAFVFAGLGTYSSLVATFFAASLLSGIGVYLWLKDQSRTPLIGALLFMVAPYHLFDFYQRGAVAEFVAIAILPFVLWGIRKAIQGKSRAFAWIALSYASLIMSHLPLALLASLFLFVPYTLLGARQSVPALLKIGGALATGVALAAIYILPAIALEPYRSGTELWALPYLQPASWSLWNAEAWTLKTYRAVLLMIATIAIPLVALSVRRRSGWALWALACAALAAGAVPMLWSLPPLHSVQFPFRLLPIAELAFVTAAALAPPGQLSWPTLWVPLLAMAGFIIAAEPENVALSPRAVETIHPDVPENLPPGQRPYSWPSRWALEIAALHPRPQFDGKITVEPAFYFPSWQVRCGNHEVPTFPDPRTKLLAHEGRRCSRKIGWTMPERISALVSLIALLILVGVSARGLLTPSAASPARRRSRGRGTRLRNT